MSEKIVKAITEEEHVHDAWYEEARANDLTMETLPAFLKKLTEEYHHDYGTIVHAITAGMLATGRAIDRSPQGGITGFQAGAVMWEFIRNWIDSGEYKPRRMVDYSNMLYPQYEHAFQKTISSDTWEHLQKMAKEKLDTNNDGYDMHPDVKAHMESIVAGTIPFGYTVDDDE